MENPKAFISYCWSNSMHEQWVLDLATELRENAVDVILDKWDLREGHNAIDFMEKMVTDPDIKKVIIVSDEEYVRKAEKKVGGVGTETQIISKEIYEKQDQEKFVVVVSQKSPDGKPFLPVYYRSRIYIDLSEPDKYAENFERLLRWIYDKPLYIKPELGNPPAFLESAEGTSLGTAYLFKRTLSAIRESKPYASGALEEYLVTFSTNLEKFRLSDIKVEFDDAVIENIEQFIKYRNEVNQIFTAIANYAPNEENILKLRKFFESLIPYMSKPYNITHWNAWDFDNFRFIIHELFLYAIAILLKANKFQQVNLLLSQYYYCEENSDQGRDVMASFSVFNKTIRSLTYRNERLRLQRLSVHADMLKQRSIGSGIEFRYLLQADFVLFMRASIDDDYWFPETLLYLGRFNGPFEIFARSVSKSYFDKVKCILNINQPSDLLELLDLFMKGERRLPRWKFETIDPKQLLGYDQLAKKA